jgi:hypothetical protein
MGPEYPKIDEILPAPTLHSIATTDLTALTQAAPKSAMSEVVHEAGGTPLTGGLFGVGSSRVEEGLFGAPVATGGVLGVFAEQAATLTASSGSAWTEHLDPVSHHRYWFNYQTQESRWTPPPSQDGPIAPVIPINEPYELMPEPQFKCGKCQEVRAVSNLYTVDCTSSHRFCYPCIREHVLNEIKNEHQAMCPYTEECRHEISLSEVRQLFEVIDPEVVESFIKLRAKQWTEPLPEAKFTCPVCLEDIPVQVWQHNIQSVE